MVQLSSVQFSWVRFSWVWFSLVELGLVQLSSVQLSSVQFSWVRFSSVEFSSVQLSLVWLIEFGLVKLCSVHLSSVQFSSVEFSWVQQPETVVNMFPGSVHKMWFIKPCIFGKFCRSLCFYAPPPPPPPSPLGHIWDVMLVWWKGNVNRTVSVQQYCVPLQWCTMVVAVLMGGGGQLDQALILLGSAVSLANGYVSLVSTVLYIVTFF